MKLIFASNNKHKIEEIRTILGSKHYILSLQDAGIDIDIPEPYNTIEENATKKSRTIFQMTGTNCFSDDTGLEVDALNGEPGVKSARYAGEDHNFARNVEKLLSKLGSNTNRKARFRAVVSLIWDGNEVLFEGECGGNITFEPKGDNGFGYDPVFVPDGEKRTFAEMTLEEKNIYNHRRKAVDKMVEYLQTIETKDKN